MTSTTGLNLTDELKCQLDGIGLVLKGCRSQAYGNGANAIGQPKAVQYRIISENSKAFFVPCTDHSLYLLLGDMETSVPRANDIHWCYSKNVHYIFCINRNIGYSI